VLEARIGEVAATASATGAAAGERTAEAAGSGAPPQL
jgi:hypothetical protein